MSKPGHHGLDQLLREAFPAVEVSEDFKLNLWRKLMKPSEKSPWSLPAPLYALAAAVGIFAGIAGSGILSASGVNSYRLDLFGNAPHDSIAGSFLDLTQEAV